MVVGCRFVVFFRRVVDGLVAAGLLAAGVLDEALLLEFDDAALYGAQ